MKKIIYTLILILVIVGGLLFANREIKTETKSALKQWEATPDGIKFKQWEASPAGLKVQSSAVKLSKSIREYTNMEGVVTSLSLPPGSRLGFGVMVRIDSNDYILAFGLDTNHELEQLHSLKVDDKIIIRSHSITKAPKYAYPIVAGDYVERNSKIMYKRLPRKGGC